MRRPRRAARACTRAAAGRRRCRCRPPAGRPAPRRARGPRAAPASRSPPPDPPGATARWCEPAWGDRRARHSTAADRGTPAAAWRPPGGVGPAPADHPGEVGARCRVGLGQQLLELVDDQKQAGAAASRHGQQQVVHDVGEPPGVHQSVVGRGSSARAARGSGLPLASSRTTAPSGSRPGRHGASAQASGSLATAGTRPARTREDLPQPEGPTTTSTSASDRAVGVRNAETRVRTSSSRPKNARCRSASNGSSPGYGERSSGQPSPPRDVDLPQLRVEAVAGGRLVLRQRPGLHRLQQLVPHPRLGDDRKQPRSLRPGDHHLGRAPRRPAVGRGHHADHRVRPSSGSRRGAAPTSPPV